MELALKNLLLFLLAIAVLRSMGKSALVQLTPYDLVAIVIIGTVAAEPLISTEVKPTIVSMTVLTLLYLLFAKWTLHPLGNRLFLGKPSILIKHGQIVEDHLEQNHVSMSQLLATLRASGYPDISKIDYAILEPIGQISIIPKPEVAPLSPKDVGLQVPYEGLPLAVIIDGRIQNHNLRLIQKDEQWVRQQLKAQGITDISQVLYAFAREKTDEISFNLREKKREK